MLPFLVLGALGWYFFLGPGAKKADLTNGWQPMVNPKPVPYETLDSVAQYALTEGKKNNMMPMLDIGIQRHTQGAPEAGIVATKIKDVFLDVNKQRRWIVEYAGVVTPTTGLNNPPQMGATWEIVDLHIVTPIMPSS